MLNNHIHTIAAILYANFFGYLRIFFFAKVFELIESWMNVQCVWKHNFPSQIPHRTTFLLTIQIARERMWTWWNYRFSRFMCVWITPWMGEIHSITKKMLDVRDVAMRFAQLPLPLSIFQAKSKHIQIFRLMLRGIIVVVVVIVEELLYSAQINVAHICFHFSIPSSNPVNIHVHISDLLLCESVHPKSQSL